MQGGGQLARKHFCKKKHMRVPVEYRLNMSQQGTVAYCIPSCNGQSVAGGIVWKIKVCILPALCCLTPSSSLAVLSGCISHLLSFEAGMLIFPY